MMTITLPSPLYVYNAEKRSRKYIYKN